MAEKRDIYNYPRQLKLAKERVKDEPEVCQENKTAILGFLKWYSARGTSPARQLKYVNYHLSMARMTKKPFIEMDKKDITDLLNKINAGGFKNESVRDYRVGLKLLFRYLRKTDDTDPPETAWFKTGKKIPSEVSTRVILEPDEFLKVNAELRVPQDRAIFTFLYWTAARITEAMSLKISDFYEDAANSWLMADLTTFKTGGKKRTVPIPDAHAVTTLKDHLHHHPQRNNAESFVFYNAKNGTFDYNAFRKRLQRASERAGITKHITPHFLRHSRITLWTRLGLTDQQIKYLAGWTQNSSMASVYIHAGFHLVKGKFEELFPVKKPKEARHELSEFLGLLLGLCMAPAAQKALLEEAKKTGQEEKLERLRKALLTVKVDVTSDAAGVNRTQRAKTRY